MRILETDTGLEWRWDGTTFVRQHPKGLLARTTRTTDISTTATVLTTMLSQVVAVPAGGRPVNVEISGPGCYSTVGLSRLAIFRDETQIQSWLSRGLLGSTAADQPDPVSMSIPDYPTPGTSVTYSIRMAAVVGFGGTSTLQGGVNSPLSLAVVEV